MIKSLTGFFRGNARWLTARAAFFTLGGFLCLAGLSDAEAQTLHTRISVVSVAPARIRIDVEFPKATNVLSFRNAYGGVLGLGERIEMVEAIKANGESVKAKQLAPGEFKNAEAFARFKYEVNVTEPLRPAQMSHVSWVNREHGLLMLADLLPSATSDSGSFATALI